MKTTVRLTLRVTPAEAEAIKSAARMDGRSVNSWVCRTLHMMLDPKHWIKVYKKMVKCAKANKCELTTCTHHKEHEHYYRCDDLKYKPCEDCPEICKSAASK